MGGQVSGDDIARRVGLFSVALAMAALSGAAGVFAFALPGMDTDAGLWPGPAAARGRLAGSPALAGVLWLSAAGVVAGVGGMAWAVLGCRRGAKPGPAADRGPTTVFDS
jgi:hypothetical protein